MIQKIGNEQKTGNQHMKIRYPGVVVEHTKDTGLGSIGRILCSFQVEPRYTIQHYVFQGSVEINDGTALQKGESIIFKDERITMNAIETSELVLFITDEAAAYYDGGMFSGNKKIRKCLTNEREYQKGRDQRLCSRF